MCKNFHITTYAKFLNYIQWLTFTISLVNKEAKIGPITRI
jgi:hypothetical protein